MHNYLIIIIIINVLFCFIFFLDQTWKIYYVCISMVHILMGPAAGILSRGIRLSCIVSITAGHDDVIKWKPFPRYWPFARGIHRSPVNSPHKGQWRGALMFSLIFARINGWVYSRETGDLSHYDVIVMWCHGARVTSSHHLTWFSRNIPISVRQCKLFWNHVYERPCLHHFETTVVMKC